MINRQSIKNLFKDEKLLKTAQSDQKEIDNDYLLLDLYCTKQKLEKKVKQYEEKLTKLLNKHTKITQITSHFKYYQNKEIAGQLGQNIKKHLIKIKF